MLRSRRFYRILRDGIQCALNSPAGFPVYGNINNQQHERPARLNMKILLRNAQTLKFLREDKDRLGQDWTAERANARIFTTGLEAVSHCYQHGFANVQMFVDFGDTEKNFTVPVVAALKI